jgi:hypothetical protein
MSYAQLGREQEASHEMTTLLKANPDYSAEKFLSDTGTYARTSELNLFIDSTARPGCHCARPRRSSRNTPT